MRRKRKPPSYEEQLEAVMSQVTPNTAFDHVVYFTVEETAEALVRCYPARCKDIKAGEANVVFTKDYVTLRQAERMQR